MQNTMTEQEVLVRGSAEHQDYLQHQHGYIKEWVNSVETKLAISSRVLLLFYVVYITVRASVASALPLSNPVVQYVLLGVDGLMLAVQSMGLEGSRPGLIHLAQEMESNGKAREAKKLMTAANMVQWLMGATAVDIVLQSILVQVTSFHGFNLTVLIDGYTYALLIARVVAVGRYLGEMAKLSHRGPKIISRHEADKQAEWQEQKQIRIDNKNILGVVEQGIGTWARPMVEQVKAGLENQMQQIIAQQANTISSLKAEIEAARMSSGSTFYLAEIGRQFEELTHRMTYEIDARVATSTPDVDALTQYLLRQVDARVDASKNTSALDEEKVTHLVAAIVDAKVDALRPSPAAPRQQPRKATLTSPSPTSGDTDKIVAINSMSKAAFFTAFDENPALLSLSSYKIAEAFRERNATEPTARRAKSDYLELHPEKKALAV